MTRLETLGADLQTEFHGHLAEDVQTRALMLASEVGDTDSVHFRNIQKDAGCSSNSRNPHWVVLVPLGKIP